MKKIKHTKESESTEEEEEEEEEVEEEEEENKKVNEKKIKDNMKIKGSYHNSNQNEKDKTKQKNDQKQISGIDKITEITKALIKLEKENVVEFPIHVLYPMQQLFNLEKSTDTEIYKAFMESCKIMTTYIKKMNFPFHYVKAFKLVQDLELFRLNNKRVLKERIYGLLKNVYQKFQNIPNNLTGEETILNEIITCFDLILNSKHKVPDYAMSIINDLYKIIISINCLLKALIPMNSFIKDDNFIRIPFIQSIKVNNNSIISSEAHKLKKMDFNNDFENFVIFLCKEIEKNSQIYILDHKNYDQNRHLLFSFSYIIIPDISKTLFAIKTITEKYKDELSNIFNELFKGKEITVSDEQPKETNKTFKTPFSQIYDLAQSATFTILSITDLFQLEKQFNKLLVFISGKECFENNSSLKSDLESLLKCFQSLRSLHILFLALNSMKISDYNYSIKATYLRTFISILYGNNCLMNQSLLFPVDQSIVLKVISKFRFNEISSNIFQIKRKFQIKTTLTEKSYFSKIDYDLFKQLICLEDENSEHISEVLSDQIQEIWRVKNEEFESFIEYSSSQSDTLQQNEKDSILSFVLSSFHIDENKIFSFLPNEYEHQIDFLENNHDFQQLEIEYINFLNNLIEDDILCSELKPLQMELGLNVFKNSHIKISHFINIMKAVDIAINLNKINELLLKMIENLCPLNKDNTKIISKLTKMRRGCISPKNTYNLSNLYFQFDDNYLILLKSVIFIDLHDQLVSYLPLACRMNSILLRLNEALFLHSMSRRLVFLQSHGLWSPSSNVLNERVELKRISDHLFSPSSHPLGHPSFQNNFEISRIIYILRNVSADSSIQKLSIKENIRNFSLEDFVKLFKDSNDSQDNPENSSEEPEENLQDPNLLLSKHVCATIPEEIQDFIKILNSTKDSCVPEIRSCSEDGAILLPFDINVIEYPSVTYKVKPEDVVNTQLFPIPSGLLDLAGQNTMVQYYNKFLEERNNLVDKEYKFQTLFYEKDNEHKKLKELKEQRSELLSQISVLNQDLSKFNDGDKGRSPKDGHNGTDLPQPLVQPLKNTQYFNNKEEEIIQYYKEGLLSSKATNSLLENKLSNNNQALQKIRQVLSTLDDYRNPEYIKYQKQITKKKERLIKETTQMEEQEKNTASSSQNDLKLNQSSQSSNTVIFEKPHQIDHYLKGTLSHLNISNDDLNVILSNTK